MNKLKEYRIGVCLYYDDGTNDTITVNQKEVDEELARYTIWCEFKTVGEKIGVESVTTSVIGLA